MNIIEEKQLRIAEVLLGSVRPFELMLGKLLGGVAVSLTLAAIYLVGGLFLANEFDALDAVPPATLAWFLAFAGIGTLMYGSLFVAAGAAVTNLKEAQNLLTPIILLVVLPMVTFGPVHQDPNGPVAKAITWFPLTTPTATVLRLSVPPGISLTEKLLAAALSLVTTLVLVWLAGRVFRFGMLHTDKAAAIRDMMRWMVRG
jgi:ABC-type Na+ efflux pump permease subunit